MPKYVLALLLLCASAGLLGGAPIITVWTTIGGWETSSTFATVQDFGMEDHWDYDNRENNFMVFYQLEAQGTP